MEIPKLHIRKGKREWSWHCAACHHSFRGRPNFKAKFRHGMWRKDFNVICDAAQRHAAEHIAAGDTFFQGKKHSPKKVLVTFEANI